MPSSTVLADLVAAIHAGFIAFIVIGLALILIGVPAGWRWVRGFCFRALHLLAITFVCAESFAGLQCPLTVLENHLRDMNGGAGYPRDFVGYWLDRAIFYDFPLWVFTLVYTIFALAVIAAFVSAPPRLPQSDHQ